jgi:hypothetical protein
LFVILDCEGLDKVPKGSLKLDKNKATTVGETATLTCDAGYEPKKGKSTITCLPSGDWEKASCMIKGNLDLPYKFTRLSRGN